MRSRLLALVTAGALLLPLSGCRQPRTAAPQRLTVFAAASLNRALEQLTPPWRQAHPGVDLVSSLAGTQELRAQIEGGAPADVLLSASVDDSEALFKAGLLLPPKPFVGNVLALGASPQHPTVKTFADALQPGVKLVVCGAAVPAGKYTAKALTALAGAGQQEAVKALRANIVSEEDKVTAAASKVALGEADAAFVYQTDVTANHLRAVELPEPMRVEARYTRAVVAHSPHPREAAAFVEFLATPPATAVLAKLGFRVDHLK